MTNQEAIRAVVTDVLTLLSDPTKWTQGENARNARGEATSPISEDAVCWCVLGAVRYCSVDAMQAFDVRDALNRYTRRTRMQTPEGINDRYKHTEVLTMLRSFLEAS